MAIDFEWVRPCDEHAQLVMRWRNDPDTLKASFDQKPKEWPAFGDEFREHYFSTLNLPPLFVRRGPDRVAFLRFRPYSHPLFKDRRVAEISINIAPEQRGKGLGANILRAVMPLVQSQGYDDLIAEIKVGHERSVAIFVEAGYVKFETIEKPLANGSLCPVERYRLILRPESLSKNGVMVIAEAGSNWRVGGPDRDWAMAQALVDVALEAEADVVKFQVFRSRNVYVENAGSAAYLSKQGMSQSISSIFEDLSMPYEMVAKLAEYCKSQGIAFLASVFSAEDFKEVDPFVPFHKIASYELGHLRLLELAARSGKPMVLSTGCATEEEIAWAVDTCRSNGCKDITLLQCTAKYPADIHSMNLAVIPWLKQRFGVNAGLSDHSRDPVRAPSAAVALGARVVEKHYTLHNRLPGPDHSFAITPTELKDMVRAIRETEAMRGNGVKEVLTAEQELRNYARRGIQALRDIAQGELFVEGKNIDILRPGRQSIGVHPRYIESMQGKPAKRAISSGHGICDGDW